MKWTWMNQAFALWTGFVFSMSASMVFAEETTKSESGNDLKCAGTSGVAENNNAKQYKLRYKFIPNEFVNFEVKHSATIFTQYGEASQTVDVESITQKHFRVVSVDEDGSGVLEMMIDRVQMSTKSDVTEEIKFDSANGSEDCPPQFRHVLDTVGRPLARIRFSATGKIMVDQPDTTKANNGNSRAPVVNQELTDQVSARNFFIIFPDEPIGVGETWQNSFDVPVSVTLTLKKEVNIRRTYQLKSVKGSLATISLKTTIITPIKNPAIDAQLIQRTPEGTIVFDLDKGKIQSRLQKTDKVVVNPFGGKSLMRASSRYSEKRGTGQRIAIKDSPRRSDSSDVPKQSPR